MDEILQSVCMLAQDQYGNYVVQVYMYIYLLGFKLFYLLILVSSLLLMGKHKRLKLIIARVEAALCQMPIW